MKVYISFAGLLIICVMALVYNGDLGAYTYEQLLLKAVAEECAAGASLCLDEEAYGEGRIVFDYEDAEKYGREHLEASKLHSRILKKGRVDFHMEFEDDGKGYSVENPGRIPAITVDIAVETDDLFRLPFIRVNRVERKSRYELPER